MQYRDSFLRSVVVIDTETTNMYPDKAEIVELAAARYDGNNWDVVSRLFGAADGIPPEASAKNHISRHMIEGLPTFIDAVDPAKSMLGVNQAKMWVAHNSDYDQTVLDRAFTAAGDHGSATLMHMRDMWICTYRLSQQLLDISFDDMQYNLSYLRYKLDLPVDDALGAHRAAADTVVCAVLFEFLVDYALATDAVTDGPDLAEQIWALCWRPRPITKWPFGKNKGKLLSEIPTDYYMWALDNMDALKEGSAGFSPDLAASVAAELEKRLAT